MAAPEISTLPDAPTRGEAPDTFAAKSNAFVAALSGFGSQANAQADYLDALAVTVDGYKDEAAISNIAAQAAKDEAQDAAGIAQSATNFKGAWPDLSGQISVPATVYHSGNYWSLLNNLADVTASEPGVSSDWTSASPRIFSDAGALAQSQAIALYF